MEETLQINFKELGKALVKKSWLIIVCAVLVAALMFLYTAGFVTPQYTAKVTMYVNNNSGYSSSAGINSSDLAVAIRLATTYGNIITSDRVLEKVAETAELKLSTGALRGMIRPATSDESEMFTVTVTNPDPYLAAKIANTVADVAPGEIQGIIEGSSAKIIDYAKVPTAPSSPNFTKNVMLGAVVGMALGVGVVILQMLLDVRIKSEEDLRAIMDVRILGKIPDFEQEEAITGKKPAPAVRQKKQ